MNKFIEFIKNIWNEVDSVVELFVYLAIAWLIFKAFNITFMQAVGIVFAYFLLNLVRVIVEDYRSKHR